MSLRNELIEFLVDQGVDVSGAAGDATPLLESGRLDSLALFNLALWIEERTGTTVDPTTVDIPREWASVRDIVAFVNARRGSDA